jgi:hypothetical protein
MRALSDLLYVTHCARSGENRIRGSGWDCTGRARDAHDRKDAKQKQRDRGGDPVDDARTALVPRYGHDARVRYGERGLAWRAGVFGRGSGCTPTRGAARRGSLLSLELYLCLETRSFGVVGLQRGSEPIICSRIEIPAAFFRAVYSVADRLRGLVGKLSRPKRLEASLSIIERILRYSSCAIELLLQSVE